MEPEVDDYVRRPRDGKREKELLKRLKQMPEEARYSFVRKLLQQDKRIGLLMATGSLRQKRYFQEILEIGFKEGNASTILPWLECAVPKLGFRQVILSLDRRVDSEPEAVDNAVYWMPRFKPQNDPEADRVWERLKTRTQKKLDTGTQFAAMNTTMEGSAKDAGY